MQRQETVSASTMLIWCQCSSLRTRDICQAGALGAGLVSADPAAVSYLVHIKGQQSVRRHLAALKTCSHSIPAAQAYT